MGPSSLPVGVAQPDKRPANRPQKRVLCVDEVKLVQKFREFFRVPIPQKGSDSIIARDIYNAVTTKFFQVNHFSKYGLPESEDEDDVVEVDQPLEGSKAENKAAKSKAGKKAVLWSTRTGVNRGPVKVSRCDTTQLHITYTFVFVIFPRISSHYDEIEETTTNLYTSINSQLNFFVKM